MKISRKYALYISASGLIMLAIAVSSAVIISLMNFNALRRDLREGAKAAYFEIQQSAARNLAEYLKRDLFDPLYRLDIERTDRLIRDFKKGMPVKSFRVADSTRRVLTDGTKENRSYGMQLGVDLKGLNENPVLIQKTGEGILVAFVIGSDGDTEGYGEVVFSEEPMEKAVILQDEMVSRITRGLMGRLLAVTLMWVLLAALATIPLGIFFSRRLSIPLLRLSEAVKGMAGGDLSQRVEIKSRDELGELAESFNRMTDNLQKTTVSRDALLKEMEERRKAEGALREGKERLKSAYSELAEKTDRLERFQRIAVGREMEMVRLKGEVNELLEKLGQPRKYEAPDRIRTDI